MTNTYTTATEDILISTIKGKEHFLLMHDEAKTYKKLIDKKTVELMVGIGNWKLKEQCSDAKI